MNPINFTFEGKEEKKKKQFMDTLMQSINFILQKEGWTLSIGFK